MEKKQKKEPLLVFKSNRIIKSTKEKERTAREEGSIEIEMCIYIYISRKTQTKGAKTKREVV